MFRSSPIMHTVSLAIFSLVEDVDLLVSLNNNKIKILDAREKKKNKKYLIFNYFLSYIWLERKVNLHTLFSLFLFLYFLKENNCKTNFYHHRQQIIVSACGGSFDVKNQKKKVQTLLRQHNVILTWKYMRKNTCS